MVMLLRVWFTSWVMPHDFPWACACVETCFRVGVCQWGSGESPQLRCLIQCEKRWRWRKGLPPRARFPCYILLYSVL